MPKYDQGKFTPRNPDKYVGDVKNIVYRSGWEKKLFIWLDNNSNILKWGSEEIVIPYISPVDGRPHRYFVDVVVQYKTKDGTLKKALIEVKPAAQTEPPKARKKTQRYLEECITYEVNRAKWDAARAFASKHGFSFWIFTERELFSKRI